MGSMAGTDSNEIRAAGFVLFRHGPGGVLEYLLLRATKHGEWGFPKGHAEPDESDRETARRETREECGLDPGDGHPWFRTSIAYRVKRGPKTVVHFGAEVPPDAGVALSPEHDEHEWLDYRAARHRLPHENSREVLDRAATFFKDAALRDRRPPERARDLLVRHVGADAPVVAHTEQVAGMARALAAGWGAGPDDAAAAGWLHDLGRARTHGPRHPLEGFGLACAEGWAGWAAPCLSHYTKGRPAEEIADRELRTAMYSACDLLGLTPLEKCVALADFLAPGPRRATIEERHADLVARYGPSPFFDSSRRIAEDLAAEWEAATGEKLYAALSIP